MKRVFDLVGAVLLLIGLAPIFACLSLLILLDDGRPIFFTQTRAGLGGRPFTLYKFRTLKSNPSLHDPLSSVTRVGTHLRRWGLDELPQLWNVARRDMSFVGPRPTLPDQVARYSDYERRRLRVLPGITGWAQIHGRNRICWSERIGLDIWYIEHWSLWLDVQILLRTPNALLSREGVYGPGNINPDFPGPAANAE